MANIQQLSYDSWYRVKVPGATPGRPVQGQKLTLNHVVSSLSFCVKKSKSGGFGPAFFRIYRASDDALLASASFNWAADDDLIDTPTWVTKSITPITITEEVYVCIYNTAGTLQNYLEVAHQSTDVKEGEYYSYKDDYLSDEWIDSPDEDFAYIIGVSAVVSPSDLITRVTGLVHRYDARQGTYELEISLGDTTSVLSLPYELRARRATAEKQQEQDNEEIIREAVQKLAEWETAEGGLRREPRVSPALRMLRRTAQFYRRPGEPVPTTPFEIGMEMRKLEEQVAPDATELTRKVIAGDPALQALLRQAIMRKFGDRFRQR